MSEKTLETLSPLGLYGSRSVFERLLNEGYIEMSFAWGPWVGDDKVVAMWIFHRPDSDTVATYEYLKTRDGHGTRRGQMEQKLSGNELVEFIAASQLQIVRAPRLQISEALSRMRT